MPEGGGDEVLADLAKVHDRAAAVLGCSVVEYALQRFLHRHFISELTADQEGGLFYNSGPLANAGDRIAIAYAFGFINKAMRDDLFLMSKIRNVFGHSPRSIDFDQKEIAAICGGFSALAAMAQKPEKPRKQYIAATKVLFIILKFAAAVQRHRSAVRPSASLPCRSTPGGTD
jgi:DNA-binding MltR family transcriptional regulator